MKRVLKSLLGGVAPILASAVGGPLAGTAVKMLAEKLGMKPEDLEGPAETLDQALIQKLESGLTPADLIAVKNAEREFILEMRKLDISEEQIHAMDRDSARQRQIQTGDKFPNVLASVVLIMFAGVLAAQFTAVFQGITIDPSQGKVLDVSLGILMSAVTMVLAYYFGSSSGSKRKTSLLGEKGQS